MPDHDPMAPPERHGPAAPPSPEEEAQPPRPRIAGARLVVQVAVIAIWIAMTVFLIFFTRGRLGYIRWVWILTLIMAVFRTLQLLSALGLLRRRG